MAADPLRTRQPRTVGTVNIIVLSVRPEHLPDLAPTVGNKPVISLLAKASCTDIAQNIESRRVLRAMLNVAAQISESYMPWYASPSTTRADREAAQRLLSSCGKARELSNEWDWIT